MVRPSLNEVLPRRVKGFSSSVPQAWLVYPCEIIRRAARSKVQPHFHDPQAAVPCPTRAAAQNGNVERVTYVWICGEYDTTERCAVCVHIQHGRAALAGVFYRVLMVPTLSYSSACGVSQLSYRAVLRRHTCDSTSSTRTAQRLFQNGCDEPSGHPIQIR